MLFAAAPSAELNAPHTQRAPWYIHISSAIAEPLELARPVPIASQEVPFQRAMRSAATPPAVVKAPLAKRSPLYSKTEETELDAIPDNPDPHASQEAPFHNAISFAGVEPA